MKEVEVNGRKVKVEDYITCKTESVIYVLMSRKVPEVCYGGQTGGRVDRRVGSDRIHLPKICQNLISAGHSDQYIALH